MGRGTAPHQGQRGFVQRVRAVGVGKSQPPRYPRSWPQPAAGRGRRSAGLCARPPMIDGTQATAGLTFRRGICTGEAPVIFSGRNGTTAGQEQGATIRRTPPANRQKKKLQYVLEVLELYER